MKRFVSLMLAVCFVSLLFGCARPNVTIVEGQTSKSEILSSLGAPQSVSVGLVYIKPGANITLVQKDGTRFSANNPMSLSISFDNNSIVRHVSLIP